MQLDSLLGFYVSRACSYLKQWIIYAWNELVPLRVIGIGDLHQGSGGRRDGSEVFPQHFLELDNSQFLISVLVQISLYGQLIVYPNMSLIEELKCQFTQSQMISGNAVAFDLYFEQGRDEFS